MNRLEPRSVSARTLHSRKKALKTGAPDIHICASRTGLRNYMHILDCTGVVGTAHMSPTCGRFFKAH